MLKQEFIGLHIVVTDSGNKSQIGIKGKIIDETKNMFTIKTAKGNKKLIKQEIKFRILDDSREIEGKRIIGRPEDRIKK